MEEGNEQRVFFCFLFIVLPVAERKKKRFPPLTPAAPPTRLKIHKTYWIGAEIPKYMQFDQAGIKSVIALVNKHWWQRGSIALTSAY